MDPLGIPPSFIVFVELLCPACSLMSNEATSGAHETNFAIGFLQLRHVAGIPSHFGFDCQTQNDFGLVRDGREVGYVRINWAKAAIHVQWMKV